MVRYLIKSGRKIKLLPNEEGQCQKCRKDFDLGENRRACFESCGHVTCLTCIIRTTHGCDICNKNNEEKREIELDHRIHKEASYIGLPPTKETSLVDRKINANDYSVESENFNGQQLDGRAPAIHLSSFVDTPPPSPEGNKDEVPKSEQENPEGDVNSGEIIDSRDEFIGLGWYFCLYCRCNGFKDKCCLGRHFRQAHLDIRPFLCNICDWSFDTQANLDQHMKSHRHMASFKCKQCEEANIVEIIRRNGKRTHSTTDTGKSYKFSKLDATRIQPHNFKISQDHSLNAYNIPVPSYGHKEGFEDFPKEIHPNKNDKHSIKRVVVDKLENEIRYTWKAAFDDKLKMHLYKVHPKRDPFISDQCYWSLVKRGHLVAHMKKATQSHGYSCAICKAKFNGKFRMERHMDNIHGLRIRLTPEETPVGDEYCPECQSLLGSEDCQKVAYSKCGHISCMNCVIEADELGCGQCTTENAHKNWIIQNKMEEEKGHAIMA